MDEQSKTKLIRLRDYAGRPRKSSEEIRMDSKFEQVLAVIDELEGRIETLEDRQLKLVRALNELLSRLETDPE